MPHTDEYFLSTAVPAISPGGFLHFYFFDTEEAVRAFAEALPGRIANECGGTRTAGVVHIQRCVGTVLWLLGSETAKRQVPLCACAWGIHTFMSEARGAVLVSILSQIAELWSVAGP